MKKLLLTVISIISISPVKADVSRHEINVQMRDHLARMCQERKGEYKLCTANREIFPALFDHSGQLSQKEAELQEWRLTHYMTEGCHYLDRKIESGNFLDDLRNADDLSYGQHPYMKKLYDQLGWTNATDIEKEDSLLMYRRLELLNVLERLQKELKGIDLK